MITERDIKGLLEAGIIDQATADEMRAYGADVHADRPRFDFINATYYFGALVVMLAFTWLLFDWYDRYGGIALMALASSYAALFVLGGDWLWKQRGLKIPGGLLFTLAICMVPIGILGFEDYMGWFPVGNAFEIENEAERLVFLSQLQTQQAWIAAATLLAGLGAITLRRFAFMSVPPILGFTACWMLVVEILNGGDAGERVMNTQLMLAGFLVMAVGFVVDRRTKEDFAFWLYGLGLAHFWFGMIGRLFSAPGEPGELAWGIFAFVSLLLFDISILLQRKVFMVGGAVGIMAYLVHLGFETFEGSLLFPFYLTFVGLAIMGAAVLYRKNEEKVEQLVMSLLPEGFKAWLPSSR